MLERLKDKVAEIRAQAVTALQRLQDPKDEECPIIRAYLFHLAHDPNNIVRRTIGRVDQSEHSHLMLINDSALYRSHQADTASHSGEDQRH